MYRYFNPNPLGKETSDCVVRAICGATGNTWDEVYLGLMQTGFELKEMPSAAILVSVPWICGCESVAVVNTSDQAINVQNANIVFNFVGIRR